jgi:tetratricopeptide (TPR) repeat protein
MRNATLAIIALLGLAYAAARADQPAKVIYRKTLHATVWIKTPKGSGTGWVFDRDRRLVITNYHVVAGQNTVTVIFPAYRDGEIIAERSYYKNARGVRGRVLLTDPRRDLAAVEVESLPEGGIELKLASEGVGPGDRVHSVGNPGASAALWVYTSGTVRQVYRRQMKYGNGQEVEARVIETQSPINPGDSGGPVVNDNGELVGVNASTRTDAALVSYCIDLSEVRAFAARARTYVASPAGREVLSTRQRAHALAVQGEYAKAIEAYGEAIRLNPRDSVAYRERGLAHRRLREYDQAIADYTEAIKIEPKDAVAYNNRAAVRYLKGDADGANADATEALRIDPKYPLAYKNRALAYTAKRNFERSVEDYAAAIRIDPKDAVAYRSRGTAYRQLHEYDKAVADFNEAIRLNPKDAVAYNNRAVAWYAQEDLAKAIADCDEAIQLQPKYALAYKNRGLFYGKKGNYDQAITDFSEAIRLNPKDAESYSLRGKLYRKKGDTEKADADEQEARRLKPAGP